MQFEQIKAKILFDILNTYQKSIYDTQAVNEMKLPTHFLFKQLCDQIFPADKDIVAAYSPQEDSKTLKTLKETDGYKTSQITVCYELRKLAQEEQEKEALLETQLQLLIQQKENQVKYFENLGENKSNFEELHNKQIALFDKQINQIKRTIAKNKKIASSLVEQFQKLVEGGIKEILELDPDLKVRLSED